MRIRLPAASRKNSQAHPFPFQIAMQTQEFLQGMIFHASFGDIAAGEFARQPDGVNQVERIMLAQGLDAGVPDEAWTIIRKYQCVFEGFVFQSVLIGLNSHWDWYIRKLSEFIRFARSSVSCSSLSNSDEKRLLRADRLPLGEQFEVLQLAIGVALLLSEAERQELREMSLVRNLGLHNRWEIDAQYLKETTRNGVEIGDLRLVDMAELRSWHSLLIKALSSSALECAKRFNAAPDFPCP
ncbi:MAG: hypothetical protein JWN45_829 [Acidobacteriaceae bacterium]|nr:hypothetical protein [Acidobacteriaceae bacterium]